MQSPKIVVIGASAGGLEALLSLVEGLGSGVPAAFFVVQHTTADNPGYLAGLLDRKGGLPAQYAVHGHKFREGTIYVAPPDLHLMLEPHSQLAVVRGPKENRTRPAIDPLFRSAAYHYGHEVIGVILSGGLDDGVAGLRAIKMRDGLAIVQHPADAIVDSMPRNAMRFASVDYVRPAAEIGLLITELAQRNPPERPPMDRTMAEDMKIELEATKGGLIPAELKTIGEPSLFTCPECHGALIKLRDNQPPRFRCHTGHAFTAQTLLAELNRTTDESFWNTVRSLQETSMLLGHLAEHAQSAEEVKRLHQIAREAEARATAVKDVGAEHEEGIRALLEAKDRSAT